jgi:hypothetical protein
MVHVQLSCQHALQFVLTLYAREKAQICRVPFVRLVWVRIVAVPTCVHCLNGQNIIPVVKVRAADALEFRVGAVQLMMFCRRIICLFYCGPPI